MTKKKVNLQTEFKQHLKYIIASFGTILIIIGIIKQYFYYYFFGVNIMPYLDISEVLLLFYKDIVIFFLSMIFIFSIIFFSSNDNKKTASKEYKKRFINEKNLILRIGYSIKNSPAIFGLFMSIALLELNGVKGFAKNWEVWHFMLVMYLALITDVIFNEINRQNIYKNKIKIPMIYIMITYSLVLFTILSIGKAYIDYRNTKDDKKKIVMVILKDDNKLISNDNKYYIGQTKNYIFFYNEIEKQHSIIKMSNVKEIIIKSR